MDDRTGELLAVAASMAGGCQDSLRQHVAAARRLGVTPDQLREAVNIGRAVQLHARLDMDALAQALLKDGELAVLAADCGCGPDCGCQKGA
jgi:AhpD family alkylhydroperoxidase